MLDQGGSGMNYAIDDIVSERQDNLWMPNTALGTEWIQVDFLHWETVIKVGMKTNC